MAAPKTPERSVQKNERITWAPARPKRNLSVLPPSPHSLAYEMEEAVAMGFPLPFPFMEETPVDENVDPSS